MTHETISQIEALTISAVIMAINWIIVQRGIPGPLILPMVFMAWVIVIISVLTVIRLSRKVFNHVSQTYRRWQRRRSTDI